MNEAQMKMYLKEKQDYVSHMASFLANALAAGREPAEWEISAYLNGKRAIEDAEKSLAEIESYEQRIACALERIASSLSAIERYLVLN